MARQRLNTGFLIKFGCALLVLAGTVFGIYKFRKPRNPAPFIQAGDEAMRRYDYNTASQNYAQAVALLPQQEDLHLKLGRCYLQLQHQGFDTYQEAVNEFTKAEELKPDDVNAWIGVLDVNEGRLEAAEAHARDPRYRGQLPQALSLMRDAADHLVALQPGSAQAKATSLILVLRTWIANITIPDTAADKLLPPEKRPTTEKRAEQAITDLTKLMADHPENEKIPYWLARAKIFQAQEMQRSEHPERAGALFTEASNQFDQDIAARPDVVGLYLSKAAILTALRDLDNTPSNNYRKRLRDTLEIAQGLVDPVKAPDEYERAKVQWAENLRITDATAAEDVYRKLIERFPDQLQLRNQLARLLEIANRQADALVVIDAISKLPGPPVTDIARRQQWDLQLADSKLVRANIEVDQLSTNPSGPQRDALIKDITASLDVAQRHYAGTSRFLLVKGRFEMANGQRRDAIDTLTAAADKMYAEGGGINYTLLRLEALAYQQGGQANRAVELLERAMVDPIVRNNNEANLLLAQMNLQNQDYIKAKKYVDWLAERLPDNVQVVQLEIQELGPQPEWSKVAPLWSKLPEKEPADIRQKAQFAVQLQNNDEAIRLWSMINKDQPGDVDVAVKLATCYQQAGKLDDARAVLVTCQKLNPDNTMLGASIASVTQGVTPTQVATETLEGIKGIKDPFIREFSLARFYRLHEQPEDELVHLLAALKIEPDNKEVLTTTFFLYLDSRRFSDAEAMLGHMSDLDVDNAHGLILHCKLALAKNDPATAVLYGRQLTHDLPNFAASWEMFGEGLMASGQMELAAEQFQTALQLQATNADAMGNLIKCDVAEGKLAAAKHNLETACQRFPTNPVFRDMRQRFEINYDNDPESVLPELTQQLKDHPDDSAGYVMDIDCLQACVRVKASQGDAVAANAYQQQAMDRFKEAVTKWPDDLRFARAFAQMYVQIKDLPNAEKLMQNIAARDHWKKSPKPLIMLGQIYMSAGKFDLADKTLKSALDLQPDSVEALLTMADCKLSENDLEDAAAVLMPGLSNLLVRSKYTEILLDAERYQQAELEVSDAMKAQPGDAALTNLMLEVYDAEAARGIEGKRELGLKLATEAIDSQHANVYAYLWRAKLLVAGPNPDLGAADKDLTFFLTSVPADADGHLLMAEVIDRKNDRDGAIRELESAMKLAPQNKGIRLYLIKDYLTAVPPRSDDAERLLIASLALPSFGNDPDFESRLAVIQAEKGENDKAVASIQKAMKDAKNLPALIPDYFRILLLTKNYDLLLTESQSTKFFTDANRPWYVYTDRAIARAALGDAAGAETDFNTSLDKAGAEQSYSSAKQAASSIATAAKPFGPEKALAMVLPRADSNPIWQLVAVELYSYSKDWTGALKEVTVAMSGLDRLSPPDQFRLLELASGIYLNAVPPMVDQALDANRKLLALDPNNIDALNNIACVLVDMGKTPQPAEALTYSQKAYDLSVKRGHLEPRVADTQGWALVQAGKVDDGIVILHKALELRRLGNEDFPEAHYHLAMGYLKIHQPSEAQTELLAAKQLVDALKAKGQPVDPAFVAKIRTALNQANGTVGVKIGGTDGLQTP